MKIAILHHPSADFSIHVHMIWQLSRNWLAQGHQVGHFRKIDDRVLSADVILLHVDLTTLPERYLQKLSAHPRVINRHVTDISKHGFCEHKVQPLDGYSGKVIIKTARNYGGKPERALSGQQANTDRQPDWATATWLDHYEILPSPDAVPAAVWQNPNLIVERFIPEVDVEGRYVVREWLFLGNRDLHFMNISQEPVVKYRNTVEVRILPDNTVPAELRQTRQRLQFDYGKFDYVLHNGKPVLFDINKTAGAPPDAPLVMQDAEIRKGLKRLSMGIQDYYPDLPA